MFGYLQIVVEIKTPKLGHPELVERTIDDYRMAPTTLVEI
jgi:hypothetical protein